MEKVFFENSAGLKLCGILEEPNSAKKEIVILVHGYSSDKDGTTSTEMAKELNKRGKNTFRIDLDGRGESEGDFANQTVSSMIDDILSAIKYIESKGYSKINLLGASGGALACMGAALINKRINKLVLKSPVSDYVSQRIESWGREKMKEWKENGFVFINKRRGRFRVNYSFFEDAKKHIMYDKAKDITCPVLIIHGDADKSVKLEQSQKVVKGFPNAKLIVLKGADHDLGINGDRSLSNKLFADFFEGKELSL